MVSHTKRGLARLDKFATRCQPDGEARVRMAESTPPTFFATTRWTWIRGAAGGDEVASGAALEQLCAAYWMPLYRYARRRGNSPEDAADLVQGFFGQLLAGKPWSRVDPARGQFRAFLLASFNHWMLNEHRHAMRQKRGGEAVCFSFDWDGAESGIDAADLRSPDVLFDRDWALTLLENVLRGLEAECRAAGRAREFEVLKPCLAADSARIPHAELAAALGGTEGAARVAVHRLRKRYRHMLAAEIERTLAAPGDVEEELRALFAALSA